MEHFPTENAPVFQYITAVNNDVEGNLWFSSLRGLFKFDGYQFNLYVNDPNDPSSLINNRIFNTHLSKDGSFWIAASNGVQVYNNELDNFTSKLVSYTESRTDIYDVSYYDIADLDAMHMLIASKRGLLIYNKTNDQVEVVDTLLPTVIRDNKAYTSHVLRIEEDNIDQNILWLLTRLGLFKYLKKERKAELIEGPFNGRFIDNGERGFSMQIVGDEVLMHSVHKNIFTFNKVNKTWKEIDPGNDKYIRNILRINDDYTLLIYLDYPLGILQNGQNLIEALPISFDKNLQVNHFSKSSLDANGYLISINGTKKLMKSRVPLALTDHNLNLSIEDIHINGVAQTNFPKELKDYQRKVSFKVNLNYPDPADSFQYFFALNQQEDWQSLKENRKVELNKLDPGSHKIYAKAISGEKVIESEILNFRIARYFYESWWFRLLVIGALGSITYGFYWQINRRKKDKEKFEHQLLGLQLNALRAQMNPHFLFNSLNSIKNYVVNKNPDLAGDYITRFSLLMRKILENSRKDILTLEQEIETLKLYVEMEQMRFNFKFNYEFNVDPEIDTSNFKIAPMLLQPFIENAIWHGLLNKKDDCLLKISFISDHENVKCFIQDNGVGRKLATKEKNEANSNKESLGIKITEDRIQSINALYNIKTTVEIEDLVNESNESIGTKVSIFLPEIN